MCGLAGVAGPASPRDLHGALAVLDHRGPDGAGQHLSQEPPFVVAHTRLAINDLSSAGDQPLYNEDRSLGLILNGEIYNSPALRTMCESRGHQFMSQSDAEVVLHLWEDEGEACLERLNGIFAFVIFDMRIGRLTIVRDPLGVKPMFWSTDGESLWFASELRALRRIGAPIGEFDPVALAQFLTFLWVPGPRTPFVGVRSLDPGWLIRYSAAGIEHVRYSALTLDGDPDEGVDPHAAANRVVELLFEAVQRQLLSDVPVGLMASGGVDSSLIWWASRDTLSRAFTIDWAPGVEEGFGEDTAAVRTLGGLFGTEVEYVAPPSGDVLRLLPAGDLFADPAVELTRRISASAADRGLKVLFSGQGGDELFGGYRRHVIGPRAAGLGAPLAAPASRLLSAIGRGGTRVEYSARLLRALSRHDVFDSYMTLCSYSDAEDRAEILGCTTAEVSDEVVWQTHREVFDRTPSTWSLLRRFRALDLAVYLPGLGLAYADRAGMHESVEVRVPFLDLDLVRFAQHLPDSMLVAGGRAKVLLRAAGLRLLPQSVLRRPKRPFGVPAAQLGTAPIRSSRGFRQARYLGSAALVLDRWTHEVNRY